MPVEVVMPRLSDTMEEGTVLKWLKKEGDEVKRGETIAEIETDKAAMELESFDTGTLSKIVIPEGQTVPVGEPIAIILTPGEPTTAAPAAVPAAPSAAIPAAPAPTLPTPTGEKVKASPLARRLAEEKGVNLSQVRGTGPEGRITKEDVLAHLQQMGAVPRAPAPPAAPVAPPRPPAGAPARPEAGVTPEGKLVDLTRMQSTIAERMTRAKQQVPHYYVTSEIDMSEAARMLAALEAVGEEEVIVGYNELIVKAAALALKKFPIVNAFYNNGKLQYNERINVGIAVALPQGLMVPVLHDADRKGLRELASESRELVRHVREGHMVPSEFQGATFSVSNLGMFDVEQFVAVINPPESSILAVGSVRRVPVVRDGEIVAAETMKVTLSADHRVYYGATAAQFLQEFKRLLQNPMLLVL